MGTREQAECLLEMLSPEDLELAYQLLRRLVGEQPNAETVFAMLEADKIAHDPNVKGYTSISALTEALEAE